MILSNKQFHEYYTDYSNLIDSMKEKLAEVTKKNPNADYRIPNYTIEKLQRLQLLFHTMYHEQQTIDNDSGKIMEERHKLITKINRLEKENENLKQNIKL